MNDFNEEDYIPTEKSLKSGYDNPEFEKAWSSASEELEKELVIGFIGTASSGKTSGIKALFDIDLGNIHPIPGTTKDVKIVPIEKNVYLVDAPGFGDIRKETSQKAKEVCDKVDVFVYVLNAEGGYKIQEKEDYQKLVSYNREVLVVFNKIDLIRSHQREDFQNDQREKMEVKPQNFIPAAFDPLPEISKEPINIDAITNWIWNTLKEKGKDLLFSKIMRNKDKVADKYIVLATAAATATGALPIPGSDIIPLTGIQVAMIAKIAIVYGHSPEKEDIIALISQTMAGQTGKQIFRYIITILKGLGWLGGPFLEGAIIAAAAVIAASITFALGKAAQAYYKSGMTMPPEEIQQLFKQFFDLYMSWQSKERKNK